MTDNQEQEAGESPQDSQINELGDQILKLLNEKCKNPGEAFVLLQQLTIFVWDQYKVEWSASAGQGATSSRKQRYMDYVSDMIDSLSAGNRLVNSTD